MHVLVTESRFGDADQLVERLEGTGCRVSTCHGQLGLCRVLSPGNRCPLDERGPVDLVVDVRNGCEELSAREYGVVCAVRANVPLLIVGTDPDVPAVVPAGLQQWAQAVSAEQLLDACRDHIASRREAEENEGRDR
ncbi:hypothetical protein JOF53_000688 [Crossiella equi]|uniref:Response regulatory domain-containing protein n=1 Tax=Crossiella equi TaxID=130796 RepID=A0ABS5A690_9PSEU|nr:hypothetical protein [Crossiella equi]MBP2471816.1 hypothetical protein [Crossiella equi]